MNRFQTNAFNCNLRPCILAVTHAIPALQSTPAAGVLILAWALTEVIRYPSYALGQSCPGWLNWLRYTIFIPLYPIGAGAEMKLMDLVGRCSLTSLCVCV